jgi:hypothetical protein
VNWYYFENNSIVPSPLVGEGGDEGGHTVHLTSILPVKGKDNLGYCFSFVGDEAVL